MRGRVKLREAIRSSDGEKRALDHSGHLRIVVHLRIEVNAETLKQRTTPARSANLYIYTYHSHEAVISRRIAVLPLFLPHCAHGATKSTPTITSILRHTTIYIHTMAGRYSSLPPPTRDSLELASLASSSHNSRRTSVESSASGERSSQRLSFDDEDPLSELNPAGHDENRPRHNRSYSVSSAFDFAPNLFPLSSTAQGYTALGAPSNPALDPSNALNGGSLEKQKSLTYLNGLSLVVGLIIGSGIFSSPSQVITNAGSPGASLLVWVVAGILAWTGAASYAELGGAIPLNGGAQIYLSKIFGEWAGFLFTWCAVVVLKPGSAAIIAIIFGEYIVSAVAGAEVAEASPWINKSIAIAGLFFVTLLNCISTKLGTRSADVFMFLKFFALIGVTIIGIVVATTGLSYTGDATDDWKTQGWFDNTSTDVSSWAVAIYSGLWAFDGWDNVSPPHIIPLSPSLTPKRSTT